MRQRDLFRWIHLFAIAVVGIGMAWSNVLMSMGQLLLVGNSLVGGIVHKDLGSRYRRAFTSPLLLVFLVFYAVHLIGLLWTQDMEWGLDLCRILAPVVVLSVVLAASDPLDHDELRALLLLTAASTVVSTIACLVLRPGGAALTDFRSLSVFISHIRLALLLCVSVAILIHYWPPRPWQRLVHLIAMAWSIFFIAQLESLQGLLIMVLIALLFLWRYSRAWSVPARWASRVGALALLCICTLVPYTWMRDHQRTEPVDVAKLEVYSAGGEMYYHDLERPRFENGHAVWVNVADRELERGWTSRSALPFNSMDGKGHPVRHTLVRYMASLGLTKDSVGMRTLSADDVHRIEMGITSAVQGRHGALRDRVEQILFELDEYSTTGNPSGYSIAMRIEFWKTGRAIARREWLMGVGTGDTQLAFNEEYERRASLLGERWRLRAHNEYLTLWISFGAIGFLLCMISWIWPAWKAGAHRSPLFLAWANAFAVSCLTDDTPETQAGATFFAFFYALFVFSADAPTFDSIRPTWRGRKP